MVRALLRTPAFTGGVVLTLGLGIGVTAAAFSVVRGILLRPLPHADGDRLVYVRQSAPGAGLDNVFFSVPEIEEYRSGVRAFDGVAEFSTMRFTALDLDKPRQLQVGIVTGNYFQIMGLGTVLGRPLGPSDDQEDATPVAVLTVATFKNVFGGDPGVLGRTFRMNGRTVTVVGVAEPHPPYPERTDMYVNMVTSPHHLGASMNHDRAHRMTEVFARLAPGATLEQARSEVTAVAHGGMADHREAYDGRYGYTVTVTGLKDQLSRRARSTLIVLMSTAVMVFLVALANVANLTLTRATRLSNELAVRASLGATVRDLRARLLSENLALGVGGALLGSAVAFMVVGILSAYLQRFSVRAGEVHVDAPVLGLTLLLGIGAAVTLAYLPRLPSSVGGLHSLARAGRSGGGRNLKRLQSGMVAAQVAVSMVLVFGAGLLARTLVNLQAVHTGMDVEHVLALDLPSVNNGRTPAEIREDYRSMLRRVEELPDVRSAAMTNVVPMRTDGFLVPWTVDFTIEGQELEPGAPPPRTDFRTVTPRYLETLGMLLTSGRGIEAADDAESPRIALVNKAWVMRFMGGRDPLGQRVTWRGVFVDFLGLSAEPTTIVGVVADVREHATDRAPTPTAFVPHSQAPFSESLLVRARGDAAALGPTVEAAIRSVEPDQPVENIATLVTLQEERMGETKLNAKLVGLLAMLSMLIAGIGVFAALTFSVNQRTREMGVRMALGADGSSVVRTVMQEGMSVVAGGVLAGVLGAYATSGLLSGLLYGVPATDPWTLLGGAALVAVVGTSATTLPAVRASRVDPARVLGRE